MNLFFICVLLRFGENQVIEARRSVLPSTDFRIIYCNQTNPKNGEVVTRIQVTTVFHLEMRYIFFLQK